MFAQTIGYLMHVFNEHINLFLSFFSAASLFCSEGCGQICTIVAAAVHRAFLLYYFSTLHYNNILYYCDYNYLYSCHYYYYYHLILGVIIIIIIIMVDRRTKSILDAVSAQ